MCIQAFLNEDTFIIAESYPEADMNKDTRQHGTKDNTTNSSANEHSRDSSSIQHLKWSLFLPVACGGRGWTGE